MSGIPMNAGQWAGSDSSLRTAIDRARAAWRRRVLLEGLATTLITALALLVLFVIAAAAIGVTAGQLGVLRIAYYLLVLAAAAWWVARPALRQVEASRIALYLEERDAGLGQTVLSAVQAITVPVNQRSSPALVGRLASQATGALERLERDQAIERPRLRRAGLRLGAVALATLAILLLGPPRWRTLLGGFLTPWRPAAAVIPPRALAVEPGNVTVPRGSTLDIHAAAQGFAPAGAVLFTRRVGDSDWTALPMETDSTGHFTQRLFDLDSTTVYRVEADAIASDEHRITVTDLPAVRAVALTLDYPDYTALPRDSALAGGDVAAVVGTMAEVRPTLTMPVGAATLRFDDGTRIPMTVTDSLAPSGRFRVSRSGFYTIDLTAPDGTEIPGTVRWAVDALPDRPPVVRVLDPGRDTRATNVEEVPLAVSADDDYGVRSLSLRYSVNGGTEQAVAIAEGYPAGTLTPRGVHTLYLEELGLQPGDLVSYYAAARDGAGNEARSDLYFIEIRPFSRNYRQAEQGSGGGGGGGGGGEQQPQLSRQQRDLLVASFNIQRDSAGSTATRVREDIATVAVGQEELRDQVRRISGQLAQRNAASVDSTFLEIREALDSAAARMDSAATALRGNTVSDAIPLQQRALQQVQRSEALYKDVELQINQGGGGGGGGAGAAPEDLADLFELETDKLRNQYEAVQRQGAEQSQAAREVDEAQQRLRELAQRVQQENERLQRMADAMQRRLGQQQDGQSGGSAASGGGGQQGGTAGSAAARRLADEAEAEARRLERLAREQQTPELERAAQMARQAADDLRRAANGQAGSTGRAAESLEQAAQGVASGQESAARRTTQELAGRAAELARDQAEFTRDAAGLPTTGEADRARAVERLRAQGEQMQRDAESLLRDIDRAARDVRGTDPRAAAELGDAANRLRETQVPERIQFGARIAGNDRYPAQTVRNFNDETGRIIGDIRDRLAGAAGSVGASPERQRQRALEQARELVRGMESLRDRNRAAAARDSMGTGGDRPSPGQGQQPGQGQGQGQQPGQGQGQQPGQGQGQGARGMQPAPGEARGGSPGGDIAGGGDARQLRGEVQVRLRDARDLRDALREQGVEIPQGLDDGIGYLERLQRDQVTGDPRDLADLEAQALESFKRAEFNLWLRIGGGEGGRPAVGDPTRVPPRFRQLVEEYYRAIARDRP